MIYNADTIDLIAERKEGGLDMFIISSGSIDASPDTQKLLLDKIDNYVGYINSEDFSKEFPEMEKDKIRIIFELEEKIPELLSELCQKVVLWTEDNGVSFIVKQKEKP
jgi:hypothetical protein